MQMYILVGRLVRRVICFNTFKSWAMQFFFFLSKVGVNVRQITKSMKKYVMLILVNCVKEEYAFHVFTINSLRERMMSVESNVELSIV